MQVSQATPNIQFNNSNFQGWDFLKESKLHSKITNRLNYIVNIFDRKRKKIPYKTRKALKSARFLEKQQYYNSLLNENDLINEFKLRYRKKTRLLIKRKVKQLKSNIALGYKYNDPVVFKWKNVTLLPRHSFFNVITLLSTVYNYPSNPTIQFLSLTGLRNNYNTINTILPVVMDLLHEDYKFTMGNVGLLRNVNHNNYIAFISNFFTSNRASILNVFEQKPLISTNGLVDVVDNALDFIKLDNIPVLTFATQLGSDQYNLNRIILLSSRFMRFLDISKFIRFKNYKKKIMIYFISLDEFTKDRGRLIQVTKRSKAYPLQIIGSKNFIKRLYPINCFGSLSGAVSNDNKIEVLCDNHLYISSLKHTKGVLLKTVSSLFTLLVNSTQPQNIIFGDSLGIKTSFKGNNIDLLPKHTSNSFNYLTPPSNLILNDERFIHQLYCNPTLFKYFLWNQSTLNRQVERIFSPKLLTPLLTDLGKFNFSTRSNFYTNSNLWPLTLFKYSIKRKILKLFTYYKFLPNVSLWYNSTLVRFMESCSGRKVYLKFNPFIENSLTYQDLARCRMWECRIDGFQRMLGPKLFLRESLRIFHLAINYKDPTFLLNWMKAMLYRMDFFKYRLLFRYFKFVMRYLFWAYFPELNFKGLKLRLKGKISVAGNARTRKLVYAIGETSHATVNNRVISDFTTVNSFTGVMGFRMTFYF